MSDDTTDIQILVSWIAVKSSDVKAIAQELSMVDTESGNLGDIFPDKRKQQSPKGNAFLYCDNVWSVLFYDFFNFEASVDYLLIKLSSVFAEAQAFYIDTEYTFSVEWKLAKDGEIIRSFVSTEGTIENFGAVTDAEAFIDWEKLELDEEDEGFPSFGSSEVLKIARQWSIDPIIEKRCTTKQGIVGSIQLQ